jgi:hypothetical protein
MAIVINGSGTITGLSAGGLPDASVATADIADNAITLAKMVGGTDGNIISYDASGDPVAVVTGSSGQVLTSAGAGAPPTFAAAAAGGDTRNFIIDGDFTQWAEGTAATDVGTGGYNTGMPSLIAGNEYTDGALSAEQSTDVPTVGASSHQSKYSILFKCTTADASLSAAQNVYFWQYITGSDFAHLHQQQVTISFWAKTASANSGDTYGVGLGNSAQNRAYAYAFTPTSTWTKFTHTVTLDTSGTWLFSEADKGLRIMVGLANGGDDLGSAETWAGDFLIGVTGMSNFMDSTSNEFYISQFQLVLGSSSPTFLGESVATVQSQVEYYVERFDVDQDTDCIFAYGSAVGTNTLRAMEHFSTKKRVYPTITSSAADTWEGSDNAAGDVVANSVSFSMETYYGFKFNLAQAGTSWTGGRAGRIFRNGTDTTWLLVDARH